MRGLIPYYQSPGLTLYHHQALGDPAGTSQRLQEIQLPAEGQHCGFQVELCRLEAEMGARSCTWPTQQSLLSRMLHNLAKKAALVGCSWFLVQSNEHKQYIMHRVTITCKVPYSPFPTQPVTVAIQLAFGMPIKH